MPKSRTVFVTREPVVHQLGGSTTYSLNLLEVLAEYGSAVTVVTTNVFSRSPLLWFRVVAPLPKGVRLLAPGFTRIGNLYLNLFSLHAWGRAISRLGVRGRWLRPLSSLAERLFGDRLYTNAWDLTPPTAAERNAALAAIRQRDATTVVVNYAFWGPLLQDPALARRKRVVLMHDLLSARVRQFIDSGTPLDSPHIAEDEELSWLDSADCVLAAQAREAEAIQPKIRAQVVVQPMVYRPRRAGGTPERGRCLFVGANIVPNQTGLRWFVDEVWPQVRTAVPHATLAVAGTICSWLEDGVPGIIKLHQVPSIETEYARTQVCVVPLRIGSGIKIKLIEALSFAKPVVSTTVGVQGLEPWVTDVVTVTDDGREFARATIELLQDGSKREVAAEGAVRLVQEHFSAETLRDSQFIACLL